jgi:hypothetical protein
MGDLPGCQPVILLGGHFEVWILPFDDRHEKGFFDIAGNKEVLDEFATLEEALAGEKIELALNVIRVFAMTGGAFRRENGKSLEGGVFFGGGSPREMSEENNGKKWLHLKKNLGSPCFRRLEFDLGLAGKVE